MRLSIDVPEKVYHTARTKGWPAVAKLGYTQGDARAITWASKSGNPIPGSNQDDIEKIAFTDERDHSSGMRSVSTTSAKIKTVEELLAYSQADLDNFYVAWSEVNSWEVTMGRRNTGTGKPETYTNFQVKAKLMPKSIEAKGAEMVLQAIKDLPAATRKPSPKMLKGRRRALEVDIMDPHFGLLCAQPEADAPWDLDIAEDMLFTALESVLSRAEAYGPFDEIVCPIGNDFFHSDDVFHRTTAGTPQPESISWHHVYARGKIVAIRWVDRLLEVGKHVSIVQVPGNHSRVSDFTLAHVLQARYHHEPRVTVDCSSSPYKFWRYGVNLVGFEHGHSVKPIRLAALMANERPQDWQETKYREWHLGDQHRKGSAKPLTMEEQGVSVEYLTGLTAPNEWHRLKSFNHQKRGATGFVWDHTAGPIARIGFHISQYDHAPML